MSQHSSAVFAAQRELHKKRAALVTKQAPVKQQVVSVKTAVSGLPAHLGWETLALTKHLRKRTPIPTQPTVEFPIPPIQKAQPKLQLPKKIKHYPSLGIQAIRQKQVPHYQVWLSCRRLDVDGKGWLQLNAMRHQLTKQDSENRLFGWRRLRQILHQGNGRFWQWDQHNGRLWLYSAIKIGQALGCTKLCGTPVYIRLHALTNGIGTFKAHLYSAWHSGRASNKPISRQTLQKITAVPERTQRHYEKQTKTKVKANLAIGATYSPESIEQHTWQRGGAVFKFVDKNGRFGHKQTTYLAWQLPNSYIGPHEQAAYGRQKRINHQLTDLVHEGAQGNGELKIKRLYFDHGKDAAKTTDRQFGKTTYWPEGETPDYSLWHIFFYS